jgi:predicted Ser/Thr protein kinase
MIGAIGLFLLERKLLMVAKIGKGHSSEIFAVKNGAGQKFVLKAEKSKSTRFQMAERETGNLRKANSLGIGPTLIDFDLKKRAILMEFVDGKTFAKWLFSQPTKKELLSFAKELIEQAKALDAIGLDHGQLAGAGKNILVREGKPVIIDFEKASSVRKCHNLSVIKSFLFRNPNSAIAAKVRAVLGEKEIKKLVSTN